MTELGDRLEAFEDPFNLPSKPIQLPNLNGCGSRMVRGEFFKPLLLRDNFYRILLIPQDSPFLAKLRPAEPNFSRSGTYRRCYLLVLRMW